jgi:hypothetical protein
MSSLLWSFSHPPGGDHPRRAIRLLFVVACGYPRFSQQGFDNNMAMT